MNEWIETPLATHLSRITYGFTNPMPTTDTGPYMITARDINSGRILYEQARSTSENAFLNDITDKSRPEVGDVLVTKDGTLGRIAIVDRPRVCINQSVALLKPANTIRSRFLKYLLEEPNNFERMINEADGSTIKHIYITRLAAMTVRVPSISVQDDILNVLGSLDEKIALNRRINETLEAMARAIFKDWFIDFGPTRTKMAGRAPYLAPELWVLFPDKIDDEEKPQSWQLSTLTAIADLNSETWSSNNHPARVEYLDLTNAKWGTIETTEFHSWDAAPSRARRVLRPGDTVVGTVRPGNGSYVLIDQDGLTGSTGFAVLRPKKPAHRELVYCAATAPDNIERLSHLADGAAYPAVRPDVVGATPITLAPEPALNAFSSACAPLIDRSEANKRENRTLAQTRDLLLPRLMSGEISVRHAEKLVRQAAC